MQSHHCSCVSSFSIVDLLQVSAGLLKSRGEVSITNSLSCFLSIYMNEINLCFYSFVENIMYYIGISEMFVGNVCDKMWEDSIS